MSTPERIPLSSEELMKMLPQIKLKDEDPKTQVWFTRREVIEFARSIERHHGIGGWHDHIV